MRIHPTVDALIQPIIKEMTQIDIAQKSNPIIGSHNEPDYIKEVKKKCVHLTYDGNDYKIRAVTNRSDGRCVCEVCGREIATKFDKDAVDTLMKATQILNQIAFFGMLMGLSAQPLSSLISMKSTLPSAAQLLAELNEFVKRDNSKEESVTNLGNEYIPDYRNITGIN